jgi:hypothetical protein
MADGDGVRDFNQQPGGVRVPKKCDSGKWDEIETDGDKRSASAAVKGCDICVRGLQRGRRVDENQCGHKEHGKEDPREARQPGEFDGGRSCGPPLGGTIGLHLRFRDRRLGHDRQPPQMSSRNLPSARKPASQLLPSVEPPEFIRNTWMSAVRTPGAMVLALPHT